MIHALVERAALRSPCWKEAQISCGTLKLLAPPDTDINKSEVGRFELKLHKTDFDMFFISNFLSSLQYLVKGNLTFFEKKVLESLKAEPGSSSFQKSAKRDLRISIRGFSL